MKSIYLLSTLFLFSFLSISCNQETNLEKLKAQIISEFEAEPGTFALAFKDLATDESILINERDSFHAASTMKTPVLIELYKQASEGKFQLSDSMLVKNEFTSIVDSSKFSLSVDDDSESELYDIIGTQQTIAQLAYDMIIASSNLATNVLIELVDARKVTQTMRNLGAPEIMVLRGVEDIKAYERGLSNSTTAYDLFVIFEKLAKGEVVSTEASQEMIDILMDQKFNDIIPALLPEDLKVAHKTGSITAVHHDSGIVYLPDGRKYVLIILSKELGDFDAGTQRMAKVSKMIYDYLLADSR